MAEFNEMDPAVTFVRQLQEPSTGPVVLIYKFDVLPDEVDRFLEDWPTMPAGVVSSPHLFHRVAVSDVPGVMIVHRLLDEVTKHRG